jgi:hypothetical protein
MSKKHKQAEQAAQAIAQGIDGVVDTTGNAIAQGIEATVTPVATTVLSVAKVLLAVAGSKPSVSTVVKGNTLPNPLHLPHGASKRAMALAVYNAVCGVGYVANGVGFTEDQVKRLSGVLLVLTGVGYCHATGKVLVGELHGTRGLAGYIKPTAAWWGTTSNAAKAKLVQAYADNIVQGVIGEANGDYAKATMQADSTMQRYLAVYGEETTNLD